MKNDSQNGSQNDWQNNSQENSIKSLCYASIFSVLILLATLLLKIPIGASGAYINLGDSFIFLSVLFLGKRNAVVSSFIASGLSDLILGSIIYIIPTIIIKGTMAFIAATKIGRNKISFYIVFIVLSEIVMFVGYFIFEVLFFDYPYAIFNVPFNLIQSAVGIIVATAFYYPVIKIKSKLGIE